MLPETIGQLFVGGMDQPFSCMKVRNVKCFSLFLLGSKSSFCIYANVSDLATKGAAVRLHFDTYTNFLNYFHFRYD